MANYEEEVEQLSHNGVTMGVIATAVALTMWAEIVSGRLAGLGD